MQDITIYQLATWKVDFERPTRHLFATYEAAKQFADRIMPDPHYDMKMQISMLQPDSVLGLFIQVHNYDTMTLKRKGHENL